MLLIAGKPVGVVSTSQWPVLCWQWYQRRVMASGTREFLLCASEAHSYGVQGEMLPAPSFLPTICCRVCTRDLVTRIFPFLLNLVKTRICNTLCSVIQPPKFLLSRSLNSSNMWLVGSCCVSAIIQRREKLNFSVCTKPHWKCCDFAFVFSNPEEI